MILNRKLLGLIDIASKDAIRPALNSIYIHEDQAVATDGYMLMIVKLPDQIKPEDLPELAGSKYVEVKEALIRKGDLQKLLTNIPKRMSVPVFLHTWTTYAHEQSLEFISSDLEVSSKVVVKEVDGEYPHYKKIIPEPKPNDASVNVNIDYLIQMLKAFKKVGIADDKIKITIQPDASEYGSLFPIVLTAKDHDGKEVYV